MVSEAGADPSERRAFERVALGVDGELFTTGPDGSESTAPVFVSDISEGGVKLHSRKPLSPGGQMRLRIQLPPGGDEVDLDLLVLSVVSSSDGQTFAAHCSFVDIPLRTLWQVVGACLVLNGDTESAEQLSSWSGPRSVTLELAEQKRTADGTDDAAPTVEQPLDEKAADLGATSWTNGDGGRIAAARLVWPEPTLAEPHERLSDVASPSPEPVSSISALRDHWGPPRTEPVPQPAAETPSVRAIERASPGRETARSDLLADAAVRCDHCGALDVQLQRMVRNDDDGIESWWLCLSCGLVTHRQQGTGARGNAPGSTTSNEEPPTPPVRSGGELGAPRAVAAGRPMPDSDFGSALKRVLAEEALIAADAVRLRAELARAEQDLHDLQMLPQLLERFMRERGIR